MEVCVDVYIKYACCCIFISSAFYLVCGEEITFDRDKATARFKPYFTARENAKMRIKPTLWWYTYLHNYVILQNRLKNEGKVGKTFSNKCNGILFIRLGIMNALTPRQVFQLAGWRSSHYKQTVDTLLLINSISLSLLKPSDIVFNYQNICDFISALKTHFYEGS